MWFGTRLHSWVRGRGLHALMRSLNYAPVIVDEEAFRLKQRFMKPNPCFRKCLFSITNAIESPVLASPLPGLVSFDSSPQ